MTPHAWTERVTHVLDVMGDAASAFVLGITRSDPGVSLVYMESAADVLSSEVQTALLEGMPPFALCAFGYPTLTVWPLTDRPSEHHVAMIVASLEDADSVMVVNRGDGFELFQTSAENDEMRVVRVRLWDLLIESNLKEHRCRQ